MHFAGATLVPESVREPGALFRDQRRRFAESALRHAATGVRPDRLFLHRRRLRRARDVAASAKNAPNRPINPYGQSKLAVEQMLVAYELALWPALCRVSLFQRGGRERTAGRRPRPGNASHSVGAARRPRQPPGARSLRNRLSDARRHGHPRLRPRPRSRRRSHRRARSPRPLARPDQPRHDATAFPCAKSSTRSRTSPAVPCRSASRPRRPGDPAGIAGRQHARA